MLDNKITQWHILTHDKWLLSCLTWIPVLLAVILWWIFSQGIVRDLPIGIVDLEKSPISQRLAREFDATSVMEVRRFYSDTLSAKRALVEGDIYAYAVIPRNFDRDIYLNNPPQVSVFYNSQYILVGKLISSAVSLAHGTFNAQVGALKQLAKGNSTTESAVEKTVAIRNQITPLFNRNSNYAQFLVSAIVPALWQIFIVVTTVMFLAANHRIYGLKPMFGEKPMQRFASICAFYLPIYLLLGYGFLVWFYVGLKWPMEGSLLPLIYAQLLTTIACMIMGSFFFFVTLDPARAMSFAGVFTAPSFAFMGVSFPATDMPLLAEIWRNLLPVSYYIEAQISQISYGVTAWETISQFTPSMSGYLIPLILTLLLIKKQQLKQEATHASA